MSTIKQVNIQTPLGETLSRNIGADALNIDYNNSSSELESTNVQDAIDELKDDLSNLSSTLEDLDDVNLSNLQNEQVIKYNSTSQKWENGNVNISGKADKVSSATNGNFASLDANGNLTDSGKKASDFAGTGTATSSANGLMSSADKTKLDNLGTASTKDVPTSGNAGSTQVVMGNDTRLSDSRKASDVYDWAKATTKPTYTASEVGAIASTAKGANNGVAELDSTGKVPSSQLPSFVDDVLEYNSLSAFPTTGEAGKIYIAKDTNKTYRWSGTVYAEISPSLALGETSSTAYRGDRGKIAYDHSQSTHARTDATKVEASSTNGNIKINGTETTVYTHPGSGTNPHGTTKSDVGLGNVGNFKAVSTVASQGLTDTEKANARANINAGTSNFSGNYNDLTNKPTIPTVNNATLTIQKNGSNVQTFTANQSSNATANITVPTKVSELTNDSGYTKNTGTITGIKMNGSSKGTSGVVDLGTVITSHQDISGKADKSSTVSNVAWDSTNKKLTKTINGTTSDVVTGATILGGLTKNQVTTALGYTPPTSDTNTTYTFATGDSNGQIKVTPSGGSAQNVSVKGLNSLAYMSSLNADYIVGGYINIHPENVPTLIPFMNNDIAYLLKRGGSAVIKYDGTTKSLDLTNCFDASPSYWAINPTGVTTITIELTLHKTFTWTNTIYVDFGAAGWRAKNVKFEVMNTNYSGDTWTQKYNNTNNNSGHCYISTSHQPVGASNVGGGFNKVRFTFSGWNDATIFRIAQLGIYNYGSLGLRETFLPKDGGNLYGSIYPNSNNGANLGSTSNYWSNAYITNINGVAVGSSPKFTDHYAWNDITGKPSSFTPASHTHNYAGSNSAGGAANSLSGFENNNSSGKNANDVTYNAHTYYTSNGPATSLGASTNDGALYSQAYSGSWVAQIAQDYRNGRLFVRGKNNGTWQNWLRVYDTGNKPTKSDVGLGNVENKSSATIRGELTSSNVTTALGFTPGTGTVTQVRVGSTAYNPSSGVISLPAYPTDTNTHRPINVNGTQTLGNNTTALNLKNGSNVTITGSGGDVTIAATNTWRGIQNNLTSDSTTDSLSAAQGKALKGLVDGKATKPTVKSATLAANATSVTFTGIPTSGNNMIDFFITDGANYTAINTATSGKITLTYAASSSARTVYCRIEGV